MSHLFPSPVAALAAVGDPTADGQFLVATGTGAFAYESGATARTSLGVAIGSDVQAWSQQLDDIAALAVTDGNIIVGNGTTWVAESGATARASLGLTIGTNVQAWDAQLDDLAGLSLTNGNIIYTDGVNWLTAAPGATSGVQAHGAVLDDLNTLGAPAADGEFLVATGAGAFAYESGNTARTSLGLGTGDSPTFANATITDTLTTQDLIVNGTQIIAHVENVQIAENTLLLNSNYVTASPQDGGIGIIVQGTATSDTISSWDTATTFTTVGTATFSANDYILLTSSGKNDGLYRVASHVGTTVTIATTGDDVDLIKTSIDTAEALTGTATNVQVAGLRYDGSAGTWEFATAAASGPLTYSTIDAGLLSGNNTWTGTQDFQNTITTDAVQRNVRLINSTVAAGASDHIVIAQANASQYTYTLPAATGSGREITVKRDASTPSTGVIVDGNGADTIDGSASITLNTKDESVTLIDYASGTWAII